MTQRTSLILAMLAAACFARAAAAQELSDDLRGRLNVEGARVAPLETSVDATSGVRLASVDALIQALSVHETATQSPVVERSDGRVAATFGHKAIAIDLAEGAVRIHDDRGYDAAMAVAVTDQELFASALPVLEALGAKRSEVVWAVRMLSRRSKARDAESSSIEVRAYKLIVERVIAGYPVKGEHLTVSFALDGTLRHVSGRWRQLDLDRSRFAVGSTPEQVAERGLQMADAEATQIHIVTANEVDVRVHTMLEPVQADETTFVLQPLGRIEVPIVAPSGFNYHGIDFSL